MLARIPASTPGTGTNEPNLNTIKANSVNIIFFFKSVALAIDAKLKLFASCSETLDIFLFSPFF
jgi:hypothetical protein